MAKLIITRINLASPDGVSVPFPFGDATRCSVMIKLASGKSWGTAVAALQASAMLGHEEQEDLELEEWGAFSPARTFDTNSVFPVTDIPVADKGHGRLRTTTADGASDPAALAIIRLAK